MYAITSDKGRTGWLCHRFFVHVLLIAFLYLAFLHANPPIPSFTAYSRCATVNLQKRKM